MSWEKMRGKRKRRSLKKKEAFFPHHSHTPHHTYTPHTTHIQKRRGKMGEPAAHVWLGIDFGGLLVLVLDRNLPALRAKLATYSPAVWEDPSEQEALRLQATEAAEMGDRETVIFFLEGMGVPVNAAPVCTSPFATEDAAHTLGRCCHLIARRPCTGTAGTSWPRGPGSGTGPRRRGRYSSDIRLIFWRSACGAGTPRPARG